MFLCLNSILVGDVYCIFSLVTFPCGILGQVWYSLIVSIPDLCRLSYFL